MATTTIDALTELTSVAAADELAIWDASASATKKITRTNYLANVRFTNVAQTITTDTTFSGAIIISRTSVTIATGAVTASGSMIVVDTEGAAASDDLDTINGGATGQILIVQTANTARDVVVKHGTGNIFLSGRADRTLSGTRDKLMLVYTSPEWHELSFGDNSA